MSIEKLLAEWQHRLALDDWYISVQDDCAAHELQLSGVAGECEWNEVNKAAVIRLITEKEYGDRIIPYDKEKTLVHELLHIKFCFLDNSENPLQNRILHQLIDEMSIALVKAKRNI